MPALCKTNHAARSSSQGQPKLIAHEVERTLRRLGRYFKVLGNCARVRITLCPQLVVYPKDARKVSQSLVAGLEPHMGHDGRYILSDERGQAMSYRSTIGNIFREIC